MDQKIDIVNQFATEGKVAKIAPVGNGWINDTYRVETAGGTPDYILQRINHNIFKDVNLLQKNIQIITDHIRKKLTEAGESDVERKALRIVPTKSGGLYYFDGESYWRMMVFVAGSVTHEKLENARMAELTGEAFGRFQEQLSDLPQGALGETIPNFHNIEFRLVGFKEAIAEDKKGRLAKAQGLVDELLKREPEMIKAEVLNRAGKLTKRVTHCDTKINNLLFDKDDRALCVIDLDTTMPGYVLSDFGDFIRTGANTGAEDDPNLDNVEVNMDVFRAFAKGYIRTAGGFLTPTERENLPFGGKLLTYMQTVRFLTDYLEGDTYYKILSAEHNLQRSYAQFKLLQSIEAQESEMNDFIATL